MYPHLLLFLWLAMLCTCGATVLELSQCPLNSISQYQTLRADDMPLCGNGVLDAGEVCDDGNRISGDGCNGWCSAFDRMTKACTLAGQNNECSMGITLASSPSHSTFCNLGSVAVSPNGKYVVVADGGVLVQMDLFTDSVMQNLFVLPATKYFKFGRFCSIFILEDGKDEILGHDCENQKIYLFSNGASQYALKSSLPLSPQSPMHANKGFLDYANNRFVVAGLPAVSDGFRCAEIYGLDLTTFETTLIGGIDCVAFNVVEVGKTFTSFSMDGMMPYRVLMETCPYLMDSEQCYVVYMERNDLQLAKAYISVQGGSDVVYTVSTDETVNVLGAPIVTRSDKSKITYTLVGNCFSATNTVLSNLKMMPPAFTLGNSCGVTTSRVMACATPLNNPFVTEVISSSYLLPNGLSATHEHQELLSIFMNGNTSGLLGRGNTSTGAKNDMFLGGLPLYRQILNNAHKGNVPIDFVEIPHTQDVIYITKTSIGLISTKGIMLMDIYNPGYCRAVEAILCPSGFFGSVGSVCKSCSDPSNAALLDTVSAQIQCTGMIQKTRRRRHLLSATQSAPFTQISMIVSNNVKKQDLDLLMNYYLMAHGQNCSSTTSMTPYQPYNMAADVHDAKMVSSGKEEGGKCSQLIPCMIESAGEQLRKNFTLQTPEEYIVSWSTQESALVDAMTGIQKTGAQGATLTVSKDEALTCGIGGDVVDLLDNSRCKFKLNKDFHHEWLPCALGVLSGNPSPQGSRRRRNLLQESDAPQGEKLVSAQAQTTFVSTTSISYGVTSQGGDPSRDAPRSKAENNNANGSESQNFMIVVIASTLVGLLIVVLVIGVVYMYLIKSKKSAVVVQRSAFPATYYSGDAIAYEPLKNQ